MSIICISVFNEIVNLGGRGKMVFQKNILDYIELPNIVSLGNHFYGAVFPLMKLLPARYILEKAISLGEINDETTIIETSSGTFGLGLAMACSMHSYKSIIVTDPIMDDNLKRRIEDLGSQVEMVNTPNPVGGIQGARLERVNELRAKNPNNFWPNQYNNKDNPISYSKVADLVIDVVGKIDFIVGTVGSGGSMCGIVHRLRMSNPNLIAVAVDTNHSVLFGQSDGKRSLRGLGNSLIPKNLDHSVFDDVHWIDADFAYSGTRELHYRHAIFAGGTSGAAYKIGKYYKELYPEKSVLAIFPDQGYRYQDTIYNNQWLRDNNIDININTGKPKLVTKPNDINQGWSTMKWERRTYFEVMGESPSEVV